MKHISQIHEARVSEMIIAIELEVDRDEFELQGDHEHAVWDELQAEFHDRLAREGGSWVAFDAA